MIMCFRDFVISYIRLDSRLEYDKEEKNLFIFIGKTIDCWWRYGCVKLSKNWFNAIWD